MKQYTIDFEPIGRRGKCRNGQTKKRRYSKTNQSSRNRGNNRTDIWNHFQ